MDTTARILGPEDEIEMRKPREKEKVRFSAFLLIKTNPTEVQLVVTRRWRLLSIGWAVLSFACIAFPWIGWVAVQ